MSVVLTKLIHDGLLRISSVFRRALRDRAGNIAFTFALLALPIVIALGVSIDFVRAYNVRVRMQSDLDAALIASVKKVDGLDEDEIKEEVTKWFAAQANTREATYDVDTDTITVNKSNRTIQAIATGVVPTTLMGIVNVDSIDVKVTTSVAGPSTSYMNVYIVIDKSPSMLLAATSTDQTSMRSKISCEFACHSTDDPVLYNGTKYSTYYAFAKARGIKLRSDVAVAAVGEVLDMIEESNNATSHIKVGLYKLGATVTEVLAPTSSVTTARTKLASDTSGLTSATSEASSYFDISMTALNTLVGSAGDGSTATSPLKLVLLLTDGVQSERNYVLWGNKPTYNVLSWSSNQSDSVKKQSWKLVTPLNPAWCSTLKTNGATMAVLYTEYLPITADWGYNATVGETMATSRFTTTWGGTIKSGVPTSTTRRDYLPYALKDCATSEDLFISAADADDIESGLSTLFQQYLGSVRLTQ